MGTLATESYIRLVNRATNAHCDQDYLDYIVFNDSSVPDRTAYILGESDENPFPVLADDIEKATAMGASFIVFVVFSFAMCKDSDFSPQITRINTDYLWVIT